MKAPHARTSSTVVHDFGFVVQQTRAKLVETMLCVSRNVSGPT